MGKKIMSALRATYGDIMRYVVLDRSGRSVGRVISGIFRTITSPAFIKSALTIAACSIAIGSVFNIGAPLSGQAGLSGGTGLRSILPIGVGDTANMGNSFMTELYKTVMPSVVGTAMDSAQKEMQAQAQLEAQRKAEAEYKARMDAYYRDFESRGAASSYDRGNYVENFDDNGNIVFVIDKVKKRKIIYNDGMPLYYIGEDGYRYQMAGYGGTVYTYSVNSNIGKMNTVLTDPKQATTNQSSDPIAKKEYVQ